MSFISPEKMSLAISSILCASLLIMGVLSAEVSRLEVEVEAMKAFKNSILEDPVGNLVDWIDAEHHCNWTGVACDPSSTQVWNISLVDMKLRGQISPFIGNLSGLQVLDLTLNFFSGRIPSQLGLCSDLVQLILFQNHLSGEIPFELGRLGNLQVLDFGNNFLDGTIPYSLFNATSILQMSLIFNNFTGKIPENIGHLVQIEILVAYGNNLAGPIPKSIGMLTNLQAFDLSQNQLSGPLPPEMGNMSSLRFLQLHLNLLSGNIPSQIGLCRNLSILNMYNNHFTGLIPPEMGNLENLERRNSTFGPPSFAPIPHLVLVFHFIHFWLYKNQLNSTIPGELFKLKLLTVLGLSQNELSGHIPSALGSLPSLQVLTLHSNRFTGPVPPSITKVTTLTYLSLGFNSFSGPIPTDIGMLYNLLNLTMNDNLLEGPIPSSIINCTSLLTITLTNNRISGRIPQGLGQLGNLSYLSLGGNELSGEIPDDFFNLKMLQVLDLSQNNFNGKMKPNIGGLFNLRILRARDNSFIGNIPREIGNLTNLRDLVLHKNEFSGVIPIELSKLKNLQGLTLFDNELEGLIPNKLFVDLKQLTYLHLQNNRLVGPIPDSVTKLELLSQLDLSGNMLNGTIPKNMMRLSRLVVLDLSHNRLAGNLDPWFVGSMKGLQLYFNLSNNYLEGKIPEEIGKLEMVQAIDLSNNNFSGSVSSSLKNCRNLFSIDLSRNNISGKIPDAVFSGFSEIVSLNLSYNQLHSKIPESLARMPHLQSLDLSHNNFNGTIPETLANISTLKHLNLSFNQLEGHIPGTGVFVNISPTDLDGNPSLCGEQLLKPCNRLNSHKLSRRNITILAALASILVLILLSLAISLLLHQLIFKRKVKDSKSKVPEMTAALSLKRYTREELGTATDSFSEDNIIGSSSLSTVYRGVLENGQVVAIKVLNLKQFSAESDKCWDREVKTLSRLRHRNLVKVCGYAWESQKMKALVLEYMEKGNLDRIIHSGVDDEPVRMVMTLSKRIEVLVSVARGLTYLHSGYDFPIVHCDLKPSNILLDSHLNTRISDFGTARMLGIHELSSSISSAFEGTIGYIAPEFAYMRKVSTKVDVFSFGVIAMELMTKRRPTGHIGEDDHQPITLHQLVEKAIADSSSSKGLLQILDPYLATSVSKNEGAMREVLSLALSCTSTDPEDRPDMEEVQSSLSSLSKMAR